MRDLMLLLLIGLALLISVHRLPAPIVEENPTPKPEKAVKAKRRPSEEPKSRSDQKTASPLPTAIAKSRPYAGTWKGVITWGMWGDYEHTIVIDDQQTIMSVKSISTEHGGTGIGAASIGSDGITAQLSGLNGKWTVQPFPDGKHAKVRVTGVFLDSSAIFTRIQ